MAICSVAGTPASLKTSCCTESTLKRKKRQKLGQGSEVEVVVGGCGGGFGEEGVRTGPQAQLAPSQLL